MDFRALYKQTFKITWQNSLLWFFGFFATFFATNEIVLGLLHFKQINNWINNLITIKIIQTQFQQIFQSLGSFKPYSPLALLNLVLTAALIILFFYLAFLSQIFLISAAKHFRDKEEFSVRKLWQNNKKFFWPVVGFYLIAFLIVFGLFNLIHLPIFLKVPVIVYIIVLILLEIFISFIVRYTVFFTILRKEPFFAAIKKGAVFFLKNWLKTIKMTWWLFCLTVLIGLGIGLVFVGSSAPFLVFSGLLYRLNSFIGLLIIMLLWTFLMGIIFLLTCSIFSAFHFLSWASFFLELNNGEKNVNKNGV